MYIIENTRRKLNIGLCISRTREAMNEEIDLLFNKTKRKRDVGRDIDGAFIPIRKGRYRVTFLSGEVYAIVGVIALHLEAISSEIIAHECAHATFWLNELNKTPNYRKMKHEERFCYTFGDMFDTVQQCIEEEKKA
jgi:hypothetical protein